MKYLLIVRTRKNASVNAVTSGFALQSNWNEITDNFDDMNLKETLLRGIYAYGFEKPSAIQQRAIIPCIKGINVFIGGDLFSMVNFKLIILILFRVRCHCSSPVRHWQNGHVCHLHPAAVGDWAERDPGSGPGADPWACSAGMLYLRSW